MVPPTSRSCQLPPDRPGHDQLSCLSCVRPGGLGLVSCRVWTVASVECSRSFLLRSRTLFACGGFASSTTCQPLSCDSGLNVDSRPESRFATMRVVPVVDSAAPASTRRNDYVGTVAADDRAAVAGTKSMYELTGLDRDRWIIVGLAIVVTASSPQIVVFAAACTDDRNRGRAPPRYRRHPPGDRSHDRRRPPGAVDPGRGFRLPGDPTASPIPRPSTERDRSSRPGVGHLAPIADQHHPA